MAAIFLINRDASGAVGYGLTDTQTKYSTVLAANTAQSITLPEDFKLYEVIFSFEPGASVWVSCDGSDAEVPGSSFDVTNSELNPVDRRYPGGTTLSFITADTTAQVGVIIYGVQ